MKKTFLFIAYLTLSVGILSTSCVPTKKLTASQLRVGRMQKDSVFAVSQMNDCNTKVKNLIAENTNMQDQNVFLKNQNETMKNENTAVKSDLNSLSAVSKITIEDQAKRLKDFQDIIQSQTDIMLKLKNSIADALMSYKTDELYIYIKDGSVYVSLEENLLYKSGSDIVDPKGKEALKTLAQVLKSTEDIQVLIEGHTDNVPIKTTKFKDNWDLSTARANSIVRILTIEYGFDAERITASGKGQFHPVKSNDTPEGRAANRRTEVILSPNLQEIYTLLYQ